MLFVTRLMFSEYELLLGCTKYKVIVIRCFDSKNLISLRPVLIFSAFKL